MSWLFVLVLAAVAGFLVLAVLVAVVAGVVLLVIRKKGRGEDE
jgi:hypothetical protein